MNINATIIGQMITFAIFVWINMRFIWPKILAVLTAREQKILQGLKAAEQGRSELQKATLTAKEQITHTKNHCLELISEAKQQAELILKNAISNARHREAEILKDAHANLMQEKLKVQQQLQANLAELIIANTEKLLAANLTAEQQQQIFKNLGEQLYDLK